MSFESSILFAKCLYFPLHLLDFFNANSLVENLFKFYFLIKLEVIASKNGLLNMEKGFGRINFSKS